MKYERFSHTNMLSSLRTHAFVLIIILIGGMLRYEWIMRSHPWETVEQFRDLYVYSDMLAYWSHAEKFWMPAAHWTYGDLLYPPGTGTLFALILGPHMDRVALWQFAQWIQTMGILLGTGLLAFLLYGRIAGVIALFMAAISFPLFDYGAYTLSETPFTITLLSAVLCVGLFFRRKQPSWLFAAGALFALSATFKSIGLMAGICLLPLFLLLDWNKRRAVRAGCAVLFCAGMTSILLPVSHIITQRNGGHFLLLSHDILRIATSNHGDILGTEARLPDGGHYLIVSPVSLQKNYQEMRVIDMSKDDIVAENLRWVLAHPLQAVADMLERMIDLIFGTLPFPTVATRFRSMLSWSQLFMLFFVYVPAFAWISNIKKRFSAQERVLSLLLLLPLGSLVATAVVAATEPRYLHPFVPLLIVLASMWYKQTFRLR